MATSSAAGVTTSYLYNGLGERVKKSNTGLTRYFAYDEAGHLLGEYDGSGDLVQETVWLGDIPVATLMPDGQGGVDVYYVHTDHLNTPRRITRPGDNIIVWRWDSEPFGATPADEDPDGDSTAFTYNLRFPGQYFDEETGLDYNAARDYDPVTGRYVQSDPIGLKGGVNTYGYAGSDPIDHMDASGLFFTSVDAACAIDPSFCAEIMGQAVRNAGALSGDPCLEETANDVADALHKIGIVATLASLKGLARPITRLAAARRLSAARAAARQGPVIIGETMARVEAAAAKIPGATIINDMPDFRAMGMNAAQATSAMMQYNRRWILEQLRSGRRIIDIGQDINRKVPSIFYQMERNMIRNYQKLHSAVENALP